MQPRLLNTHYDGVGLSTRNNDRTHAYAGASKVDSGGKSEQGSSNKPGNGPTGNAGTPNRQEGATRNTHANRRDLLPVDGNEGESNGSSRRGYDSAVSRENVLQFLNRPDELVGVKIIKQTPPESSGSVC